MGIYQFNSRIITPNQYPFGYDDAKQLWTPAEISKVFWFDSANADSIILNNSGDVVFWSDISGNNKHAYQDTMAFGVDYGRESINDIDGLSVDGTQKYLSIIDPISVSAGIELFVVVNQRQTGSDRNGDFCTFSSYTSFQGHFGGGQTDTAIQDWYSTFFSTSRSLIAEGAVPPGEYIVAIRHTGTSLVGRLNGVDESPIAATFNGSPTMQYLCGMKEYASFPAHPVMTYAEYIMVQSPTEITRYLIEGYLAHKWGMQNRLFSTHPYKISPPRKTNI